MLSHRKAEDTAAEIKLRRVIWAMGMRYRLYPRIGERLRADFLVLGRNVCVWVDGCYWHQCPKHKPAPSEGPNVELWRAKFGRTRERDRRAVELAEAAGYSPLRVWECDVMDDVAAVAKTIARLPVRRAQ